MEQSAEAGFKDARHELAKCLLDGELFSKDVDRAIQLMERSVEDGDQDVYFMVGSITEDDLTSARKVALQHITKRSADLFNKYAAYEFAQQKEAEGSNESLKEAHHYFSSAAALGHHSAAFDLARCYQFGIGCDEELPRETASIYYHQAFIVGNLVHKNLAALAEMYADGVGVSKNYVFAYALSNFAGATGEDKAITLRDSLEAKMSTEQIGKAQDMTQEWNDLSQIKDNRFFPDWMREHPNYTLLQEEAKAKKREAAKEDLGWAKIFQYVLASKVNNPGDKGDN